MARAVRKSRDKTVYRCERCGHVEGRWLGRCPSCQEWNCLVEEVAAAPGRGVAAREANERPVRIADVRMIGDGDRRRSGIHELDRVLGGGLVPGSLILLGGDPGVGKSTLLSQLLSGICSGSDGRATALYVSGEESAEQAALRARRIGADAPGLSLYAETSLERILAAAGEHRPSVVAIDSIQTIQTDALDSIPGSVAQVRECAGRLLAFAKSSGIPTILVGHVTKDGALAGPKTLEHVVDAVLHFEGEGASPYRIVRAVKNRFGSTHEIGVFEMRSGGLAEVANPSALFLAERPVGAPGSAVVASAEGSRTILVEVQALVAPSSAGVGRRTAAGVDGNRVSLLLAVLAQRAGLNALGQDVFVNVAGGVRLSEPAVDLAVASAVASSARGTAIDPHTVIFGEVGLAGEIRAVSLAEARLSEARKLGFRRCILPAQNRKRIESATDLDLVGVTHLGEVLELLR